MLVWLMARCFVTLDQKPQLLLLLHCDGYWDYWGFVTVHRGGDGVRSQSWLPHLCHIDGNSKESRLKGSLIRMKSQKSCESSSDGIGILAFWTFEITRPSWKCNLIARRWEIPRMVYIVHMTCVVMVQYFISLWVDFLVTFCRVITSQQIISSYWRFLNSVI